MGRGDRERFAANGTRRPSAGNPSKRGGFRNVRPTRARETRVYTGRSRSSDAVPLPRETPRFFFYDESPRCGPRGPSRDARREYVIVWRLIKSDWIELVSVKSTRGSQRKNTSLLIGSRHAYTIFTAIFNCTKDEKMSVFRMVPRTVPLFYCSVFFFSFSTIKSNQNERKTVGAEGCTRWVGKITRIFKFPRLGESDRQTFVLLLCWCTRP